MYKVIPVCVLIWWSTQTNRIVYLKKKSRKINVTTVNGVEASGESVWTAFHMVIKYTRQHFE